MCPFVCVCVSVHMCVLYIYIYIYIPGSSFRRPGVADVISDVFDVVISSIHVKMYIMTSH